MNKDAFKKIAKKIIKEAIKSAIYIDENAEEPYSVPRNTKEAHRCKELYNTFKKAGISLAIYRYQNKEKYEDNKEYLFKKRDLVLLDWKLSGEESSGEESLELLSEIVVNHRNIHFCAIYTTERDKDSVLKNILAYFSGCITPDINEISDLLSDEEEYIDIIKDSLIDLLLYQNNRDKTRDILSHIRSNEVFKNHLQSELQKLKGDLKQKLIKCGIAFGKLITSDAELPSPTFFNKDNYVLYINNTVIAIINKDEVKTNCVYRAYVDAITSYQMGVMQLIGLEMMNIITDKEAFISKDVLQVTPNALGYHKKTHPHNFESFIKSVMIEHIDLILHSEKLSFIEQIPETKFHKKDKDQYLAMNIFYNSICLNQDKQLEFGDVFKFEDKYYICITPLCDCADPQKRNNMFYFVRGQNIDIDDALKLGDSGFISYLDDKTVVQWDDNNERGQANYIVPLPYFVENNTINAGFLHFKRKKYNKKTKEWEDESCDFEYKTTIKQNYAQRIANHALMHPIRVGIDFVKKQKK
jgi:hypothetical protein